MKIVIVCSNYLYAEGLKRLLHRERGMTVAGVFTGCGLPADAGLKMQELGADIVLSDYEAIVRLLTAAGDKPKIILIGCSDLSRLPDRHMRDLFQRGVIGILPRSADLKTLKKALHAVHSGELWLDRAAFGKLLASQRKRIAPLGKREEEIVEYICRGYRNREIAGKLQISEQTVKSYCNRIYRKLGVPGRLHLALYSERHSYGAF